MGNEKECAEREVLILTLADKPGALGHVDDVHFIGNQVATTDGVALSAIETDVEILTPLSINGHIFRQVVKECRPQRMLMKVGYESVAVMVDDGGEWIPIPIVGRDAWVSQALQRDYPVQCDVFQGDLCRSVRGYTVSYLNRNPGLFRIHVGDDSSMLQWKDEEDVHAPILKRLPGHIGEGDLYLDARRFKQLVTALPKPDERVTDFVDIGMNDRAVRIRSRSGAQVVLGHVAVHNPHVAKASDE
jgi:hypothetical protein